LQRELARLEAAPRLGDCDHDSTNCVSTAPSTFAGERVTSHQKILGDGPHLLVGIEQAGKGGARDPRRCPDLQLEVEPLSACGSEVSGTRYDWQAEAEPCVPGLLQQAPLAAG
jgi:hypothetical protein